jgi:two-component system, cell cycle sensor histidine kinase and response regulator CckA
VREDSIPHIRNSNVAQDYEKILRMVKGYAALIGCRATVTNNLPQGSSSQEPLDPEAQLTRLLMALSTAGDELATTNTDDVASALGNLLYELVVNTIAQKPELAVDLSPIPADRPSVTQALVTLSENAADNLPLKATLSIKTSIVDRSYTRNDSINAEQYLCLELSSTGLGKEIAINERLAQISRTAEGFGIGVSLVYALIKKHSGFVDINSEPGRGTTVRLGFALAPAIEMVFSRSSAARGTILLVEEQRSPAAALKEALRHSGYNVIVALDGTQAVELHQRYRNKIDLMLLDLDLPKVSAWHVIAQVRRENPNLKVLVASGYMEPAFKSKMASAGVREFIEKPYVEEDLIQLVHFLMSEKASFDQPVVISSSDS